MPGPLLYHEHETMAVSIPKSSPGTAMTRFGGSSRNQKDSKGRLEYSTSIALRLHQEDRDPNKKQNRRQEETDIGRLNEPVRLHEITEHLGIHHRSRQHPDALQAGDAALQFALRVGRRLIRHDGGKRRMHEAFRRMDDQQHQNGEEARRHAVTNRDAGGDDQAQHHGPVFAQPGDGGPGERPARSR